jgi:anti-sigma regulatory factor (Ser/Thr protein kinase)
MITWNAQGGAADVRQARVLVGETMSDQSEAKRDAAILLADECVANAVKHGGGTFELTIQRSSHVLRVEVVDQSPTLPVLLTSNSDNEGGRGLTIVTSLASRWGAHERAHGGKVVWFEVSLD